MTSYTMATIVGANSYFVSNDMMVVQDSVNLISASVETLVMEFNQAAYEKFLQGFMGSPKPMRSIRRIHMPSRAPAAEDMRHIINACAKVIKAVLATNIHANRLHKRVNLPGREPSIPGESPPLRQNRNAECRQRRRECH